MSQPTVVPASEWRRYRWRALGNISTPAPEVWVHHGASGTASLATLLAYERYHVETLGWAAIGYSWCITRDGTVYEGRGWGKVGGHTYGRNLVSHGILLVGNWSSGTVPQAMVNSLAWLVREGNRRGFCPLRITGGHKQSPSATGPRATACPGNAGMDAVRRARLLLTERTWFDMATKDELRTVVREELGRHAWLRGLMRWIAGDVEESNHVPNMVRQIVREEVAKVNCASVDSDEVVDKILARVKAAL